MDAGAALFWANKKLSRHKVGIPTIVSGKSSYDSPALDAEILLSAATGYKREDLLIHPEKHLTARQFTKFKELITRRARHEPVAYIIGEKEFFGLKFKVNRSILIPRPETELLVEEAIKSYKLQATSYKLIIDIGTGSGAIAVALAKNLPKAKIIATDISSAALKFARQNAKIHDVTKRIKFVKADLLPKLSTLNSQLLTLIVANLPYLPAMVYSRASPEVKKYEPKSALWGGPDGLDLIKKLLFKIKQQNIKGIILLEIDPSQPKKLSSFIKRLFPEAVLEIKKDLAGLDRLAITQIA